MSLVDLSVLEVRIGHQFAQPDLAIVALTHVSSVGGSRGRLGNYQRLEFLGDRVLGLAISDMLYGKFPTATEGELSRRLAELVRRESCAEVAEAWNVGPHIRLGPGESRARGRGHTAIMADVCEAVIGAVFLDGGFPAAAALVRRAWGERMHAPRRSLQDAKTTLQEWAQGRGKPTPVYTETERSGPPHAPHFTVGVRVEGCDSAEGRGPSKRIAEQAAAEAFLQRDGIARSDPRLTDQVEP